MSVSHRVDAITPKLTGPGWRLPPARALAQRDGDLRAALRASARAGSSHHPGRPAPACAEPATPPPAEPAPLEAAPALRGRGAALPPLRPAPSPPGLLSSAPSSEWQQVEAAEVTSPRRLPRSLRQPPPLRRRPPRGARRMPGVTCAAAAAMSRRAGRGGGPGASRRFSRRLQLP